MFSLRVTLCASAYQELEKDTIQLLLAKDIVKLVKVPAECGIGSTVIFLADGRTVNVLEQQSVLLKRLAKIERVAHHFDINLN